jgi:hypothetical protein
LCSSSAASFCSVTAAHQRWCRSITCLAHQPQMTAVAASAAPACQYVYKDKVQCQVRCVSHPVVSPGPASSANAAAPCADNKAAAVDNVPSQLLTWQFLQPTLINSPTCTALCMVRPQAAATAVTAAAIAITAATIAYAG